MTDIQAIAQRRRRIDVGTIPMRELSHILNSRPRLIIDQHLAEARRKFGDDCDAVIVRRVEHVFEFQHD